MSEQEKPGYHSVEVAVVDGKAHVWVDGVPADRSRHALAREDVERIRAAADAELAWDRYDGTDPANEQERQASREIAAEWNDLADRIEALPPPDTDTLPERS